ncbi:FHA domain-containing protein [Besnoitia besnoiti]|uniref:FHA domain-containing protein n=1 Tax=Besnoitia besnoiti TaxID=94643 RepID=A0A2A9M475_BESBE|nr:FHA domain-containing protein [Besnoitia besnoiti]PFH32765.1 FHA domain-containing protein [Besnoitia besnoiti]
MERPPRSPPGRPSPAHSGPASSSSSLSAYGPLRSRLRGGELHGRRAREEGAEARGRRSLSRSASRERLRRGALPTERQHSESAFGASRRRNSREGRRETPGACGGHEARPRLAAAKLPRESAQHKRERSPARRPHGRGSDDEARLTEERQRHREQAGGGLARLLQAAAGASAAAEREVEARREATLKRAAEWRSGGTNGVEREGGDGSWDVKHEREAPHAAVKAEERGEPPAREDRLRSRGRFRDSESFLNPKRNGASDSKHAWGRAAMDTGAGLLQDDSRYGRDGSKDEEQRPVLKPNFEPSGLLKEEQGENLKNGVTLKHTEPADAAMPTKKWRLYMFKKDRTKPAADAATQEPDKTLHIHRRSSFIFGKDTRVADILLMHPTISKQHAVLQFRKKLGDVSPYIIDLESTNGTYLNGAKIETCRYYQLREQDTLRFGKSSRDFVLLHTGSVAVDLSYDFFLDSRKNEVQMTTD